jgi:hypothetical protein
VEISDVDTKTFSISVHDPHKPDVKSRQNCFLRIYKWVICRVVSIERKYFQ